MAVKFGKLLLARQLAPHRIKQAFLEGINHVSSRGSTACSPADLRDFRCCSSLPPNFTALGSNCLLCTHVVHPSDAAGPGQQGLQGCGDGAGRGCGRPGRQAHGPRPQAAAAKVCSPPVPLPAACCLSLKLPFGSPEHVADWKLLVPKEPGSFIVVPGLL